MKTGMSEMPEKHRDHPLETGILTSPMGCGRYKHLPALSGKQMFSFYFCGNRTITIPHVGSATRTMNHRKGPSAQATTLSIQRQGQILYLPLRHDYKAGPPPLQPEVVIHCTMLKLYSY